MKSLLSAIVRPDQRDWDIKLPEVLMCYNNTVHSQTGLMPSEVFLGIAQQLPLQRDQDDWVVHEDFVPFSVGSWVGIKVRNVPHGLSPKLYASYDFPFEVLSVFPSGFQYQLGWLGVLGDVFQTVVEHHDRLHPWH